MLFLLSIPVYAWVLLLSLPVAWVTFCYLRMRYPLPLQRRRWLLTLRLVALLTLIPLLGRPIWRHESEIHTDKRLAILIDRSASMSVKDSIGGKNRLEATLDLLRGGEGQPALLDALAPYHPQCFFFGEKVEPGDLKKPPLPDNKATLLQEAAAEVLREQKPETLLGLLIFSDGRNPLSGKAEQIAAQPVPVYAVGMGSRLDKKIADYRDIALGDLKCPDTVFLNTTATAEICLRCFGEEAFRKQAANANLRLILKQEEEVLAERSVLLHPTDEPMEARAEMKFVPKKRGILNYSIETQELPGEATPYNNKLRFRINVTDPKLKTLYLDGVLRHETKWLQKELGQDPNILLTTLLRTGPNKYTQSGVSSADLTAGPPRDASSSLR